MTHAPSLAGERAMLHALRRLDSGKPAFLCPIQGANGLVIETTILRKLQKQGFAYIRP